MAEAIIALAPQLINIAFIAAVAVGARYLEGVLNTPTPQTTGFATPVAPKPDDGKYNLRQNVPPLSVVLGRTKKGGDYVALEERNGTAYHIIVHAGHRIEGYVQHYLHDEAVTLNGSGVVTAPAHFNQKVKITSKLGLDAETAYATMVSVFPEIWTADHRGDGLASAMMEVQSVSNQSYLDTYPQQMPLHTAVMDGALLYDPRTETTAFSTNIALFRMFHLMHPSGGKLTLDDLYLPDWINAANVCDEEVTNRDGGTEARYHGGFWYRYDNDPVEIGRLIDQAGELVVYERGDGKIGVHAGKYVAPDIRLTEADITAFGFDANARARSTVLAVRGRYTDPSVVYNTVDAAIYGNPYAGDDDTQRTRTFENQIVQSHNHCQRLQKLTFTRANAPRVRVTAHYDAARNVPYRRFVKVHYPARGMNEAIVEIVGRPKLSLARLLVEFEGIVVSSTLYDFVAATEEGEPGGVVDVIVPGGVPEPTGFSVSIGSETITGGSPSAFAAATWTHVSDALNYELEYGPSDESSAARSVMSLEGAQQVRTGVLPDGEEYRFRLRAWSGGASSDWTDYETVTIATDASAPGQPTGFSSSKAGSTVTLTWTNPNSANFFKSVVYRGTSSSFGSAVAIATLYGGINSARSYDDAALSNGTYYWWVKAFNASDVGSTEVGPQTQTIP